MHDVECLDKSIHGISLNDVNLSTEESSVLDLYPQISAVKDVDGILHI